MKLLVILFLIKLVARIDIFIIIAVTYSSGSSIRSFPSNGFLVKASKLIDQAAEVLTGETISKPNVPILGFFQPAGEPSAGRIVVYGDSNCFDSAQSEGGM